MRHPISFSTGVLPGFLVLALLLVVAVTGCSSNDQGNVDPAQVLAESADAMKTLQSFHFTYEVTKPQGSPKSTGLEIVRIVGDVIANGNMDATIDLLQNDVPLQVAFMAVDGTHYVQDPTSQKWQSMPAAFSPVGSLNLNTGTVQILERIGEPEYVGTEDIGGTRAYHIKRHGPGGRRRLYRGLYHDGDRPSKATSGSESMTTL